MMELVGQINSTFYKLKQLLEVRGKDWGREADGSKTLERLRLENKIAWLDRIRTEAEKFV